ncbi:MAG: permease-like cell division protein FtsX, partial [Candidatus Veblenbacteria bacterium]|nr:permease-like cell division protein FtsX [Candidatus Veblenbacteria bacterium]
MMLVTLTRVITFAFQNFWRNIWLSIVTVTIVTLSLISISLLGALSIVSSEALTRLDERIDISVYLKPELAETDVQTVKTRVEGLAGVKSVELVPAAEALARFKERHATNPLIAEALLELGENPLGASLVVKAVSEQGYQQILDEVTSEEFKPYVQEARYDDYRRVIEAITDLSGRLTKVGEIVSLIFLIISVLVVFNTIRMNIYTHREEISIMRLVGASNSFIRAPFVVESALYALLATLLTAAVFFPALQAVQPYVDGFFNGYRFDLVEYFTQNSLMFFGLQFLGATLLSILASL